MTGEIESHITTRVADFVGASKDLEPTQLYDLLFQYRSTVHPDKFQGDSEKEQAEERFKKANSLLQELSSYLQQHSLSSSPRDMILLNKDYELVRARELSILQDDQLRDLKSDLDRAKWEIRELKRKLRLLGKVKIAESTRNLKEENHMKPAQTASAAFGIVLGGTWATLTQLAEVFRKIKDSLPSQGWWTDIIAALLILGSAGWLVISAVRRRRLENFMQKIALDSLLTSFQQFLEERDKLGKGFTDADIAEFVRKSFGNPSFDLRGVVSRTRSPHLLQEIKNAFLIRLLGQDLVQRTGTKGLLAEYRITDWYSYYRSNETDGEPDEDEIPSSEG